MILAATFLPRIAFALRASRVAPLPPLTHAAAQAGWFERLSSQKYNFGKVQFTQSSTRYLEKADESLKARRKIIKLLDLKATLFQEDAKKIAYVSCVLGENDLQVASNHTKIRENRATGQLTCRPLDLPEQHGAEARLP